MSKKMDALRSLVQANIKAIKEGTYKHPEFANEAEKLLFAIESKMSCWHMTARDKKLYKMVVDYCKKTDYAKKTGYMF